MHQLCFSHDNTIWKVQTTIHTEDEGIQVWQHTNLILFYLLIYLKWTVQFDIYQVENMKQM